MTIPHHFPGIRPRFCFICVGLDIPRSQMTALEVRKEGRFTIMCQRLIYGFLMDPFPSCLPPSASYRTGTSRPQGHRR